MPIHLIIFLGGGGGGGLESIKGEKYLPFPSHLMHETFFLAPNCYSQNDVESDTEEDEFESDWEGSQEVEFYDEEIIPSLDLEEMSDPHSSKFRSEGLLMTYEDEPSFEGYLQVKVRMDICVLIYILSAIFAGVEATVSTPSLLLHFRVWLIHQIHLLDFSL